MSREARLDEARQECARLQQALDGIRRWFHDRPWEDHPDAGSFGGHPYSREERDLGYGTWRDPRFLPEALAGPDTPEHPEEKMRRYMEGDPHRRAAGPDTP